MCYPRGYYVINGQPGICLPVPRLATIADFGLVLEDNNLRSSAITLRSGHNLGFLNGRCAHGHFFAITDKKHLESAISAIAEITGQKPMVCKARKSVSNFKLRKGYDIGCKVTLRGRRMYEFVERLIAVAIPRLRDFRGLSPSGFDGRGNYSMGLAEQSVFPEINLDKMEFSQGMNVTFVTTASNDDEGRKLLTMMGMPFQRTE